MVVKMTLKNFLKLHDGGVACVSIEEKEKKYFEEESQEDILESETFKEIASRPVKRFCVIGGGCYKVELVIELEKNNE